MMQRGLRRFIYNSKTRGNMGSSSRSITPYIFDDLIACRKHADVFINQVKVEWSDLHLSIVRDYFANFSWTCDFPELPSAKYFIRLFHERNSLCHAFTREIRIPGYNEVASSFLHELQQWFVVPMLKKSHESENRIKKYHMVEAFITFLLQLLCHRTESITDQRKYWFDNLEKELRFLLAIVADASLMLCADEHEEFQKVLAEFEAVANEAGFLVHSLFFSVDRALRETNEGIGFLLNHIHDLKADIIKFLNLLSSIRRSAYTNPRTSVVESLPIVDTLIHDLDDLMKWEDDRIADVKDQIEILLQGLILSRSFIKDIESPHPSEIGELKEPLMRMGDVARDAEYLILSFLLGEAPLWYLDIRLADVNRKIELIGTEFLEIAKKEKIGDLKVAKYFSAKPSLQAKSNTKVDDVTVGLEEEETYILDQLVGEGKGRLQVISIYGMPGLGKTTLAKKLYNHPLVNYHFHKLSWCVISQTYRRQSILTDIFIHLTSEISKDRTLKMDEENLVERIYKTLKGRRYLIVMDDIWDSNVWDDLRRCFPDDGNGSRILFTTRNKDVAPPHSITYELPSLPNDQCWELLEKKVFGNKTCPPELIGIGREIAANCRGLPLAVVVIAGILSTMNKKKSEWEEVKGNLASYVFEGGDNSVMQILELSYKHLSEHLKPCFLYLGAFREDEQIRVRKLMRLWIAEGFINKEEGKTAENVAEEYLMELIGKSLVMVSKRRSDGGAKTCVIHDLFREFCLKRSKEENFLKLVKSDTFSICEKSYRIQARNPYINLHYCQQVRSFHCDCLMSDLYVHTMRSLRVLHFNYFSGGCYIGPIEYLVNLRYLVIPYLPPSIGSLVNLEYLTVRTSTLGNDVCLPSAVMKMKKLRYICAGSVKYGGDCNNNSQTSNLEFLSHFVITTVKDEEMLKCSPHLRKLKCTHRSENFMACIFDLRFLTQLASLNLFCGYQTLDKFRFPSNMRKLTLCFGNLEGMSIIGRLKNLEVLKLRGCDFEGERWDTRDGEFQKLRFLELVGIRGLMEWNVASSQHFPKLQQLVLIGCSNLQEIPFEIGEIPTLQLIEVRGECTLLESAKRIREEQLELGNKELRVVTTNYDDEESEDDDLSKELSDDEESEDDDLSKELSDDEESEDDDLSKELSGT